MTAATLSGLLLTVEPREGHLFTRVEVPGDDHPDTVPAYNRLIGSTTFDVLTLREHRLLLIVDDEGLLTRRPVNLIATLFDHATGRLAAYPLAGDVLLLGLQGEASISAPAWVEQVLAALQSALYRLTLAVMDGGSVR